MRYIDIFESFSADFEAAVIDNDWSRLEKHLAEDATYLNVGGPDPKSVGREAIIDFLKADVENFDRKFDTRTLISLTSSRVEGNRLTRQWRCTYTLAEVPDLVTEGEARYLFENDLIKEIEEEVTADTVTKVEEWMQKFGDHLHG